MRGDVKYSLSPSPIVDFPLEPLAFHLLTSTKERANVVFSVSLNPARHGQDSGPQTAPQQQTLTISKVEMRMENKSKASMNPLFRVFTVPAVARAMSSLPGAWLSTIETSRTKIIKQREWQGSYHGYDVWKDYRATKPYTEKRMFRHCAEAHRTLYCVSGQPGTLFFLPAGNEHSFGQMRSSAN